LIALRNAILCLVTVVVGFSCVRSAPLDDAHLAVSLDTARVRRELEKRYAENIRAFLAKDLAAIMALRTED
jgi:hypothetical protein